jgi:hypothetical protein
MTFAVSGCFRDGVTRVSWEVKVRRQGIATPRPGNLPGHDPALTGHQLIEVQEPVMDVIALIVLGLGAGVIANVAITGRSRQRSRNWADR